MPRTTSLVELRTIEAGLRYAADSFGKIPPGIRGTALAFVDSTPMRVSDLRSVAEAHRRLTREIRRRAGGDTAADREAAEQDAALRVRAPALARALGKMVSLASAAGDWSEGARAAALEEAKAELTAAGGWWLEP